MFNKKIVLGIVSCVIIIFVACIKINIINTKALSPNGNAQSNYAKVSEEFGEDFEDFIMDNADVKIYPGEEGIQNTVIKIKDKEFIINTNHIIFEKISDITKKITNNTIRIKDSVSSTIKNITQKFKNNENNEEKGNNEKENDRLKGIVDDLIDNLE